jgi:hypothetical protein
MSSKPPEKRPVRETQRFADSPQTLQVTEAEVIRVAVHQERRPVPVREQAIPAGAFSRKVGRHFSRRPSPLGRHSGWRYIEMMREEEVDRFAFRRPFQPFEVRLADGQRFRLRSIEEFMVGRYDMAILMKDGTIGHIGIGLITSIRPLKARRLRAS